MASVAFHLAVLTLALLFSEVRRFGPVAAENVAVDIVTPDQAPEPPPTPKPETSDAFDLASKSTPESSAPDSAQSSASQPSPSQSSTAQPSATEPSATQPAAAPPPAAAQPQSQTSTEQAALAVPSASVMPTPAQTPDRPPPAAQPQATAPTPTPPQPAYVQPQPDLSVKYHVRLGLPQAAPGDVFRGPATENAEIEASSIGEFRRHLKSCSILPKSVAPSDDVAIKLRILLTRDGRLAAEPLLIEAKASVKGPLLTQAAIGALQSCQPYSMLPVDKYDEWKVLDVTFTPRDFGGS